MPTYCFRDKWGKIHDVVMSIKEKALREGKDGAIVLDNGRTATRDILAERGFGTASDAKWPMRSKALAVAPSQIAEATEHAKKSGVPTEFDRRGHPILTGPKHSRAYRKSRGFHDNDGFFG